MHQLVKGSDNDSVSFDSHTDGEILIPEDSRSPLYALSLVPLFFLLFFFKCSL